MKILIAEDDPVSRRVLEAFLQKWGFEVISTINGAEASDVLGRPDPPRIALLDWMMPELDGVEVCRRSRLRSDTNYAYIILLTAKNAHRDLLEALAAGADDYLTKPFDPPELRARLQVGRRIVEIHDELIRAREAMRFRATHDGLTDVLNHDEILSAMERELDRAKRSRQSTGIIMVDADHFKRINDVYGHLVGDEVLRGIAARIRSGVRSYDSIGRYGGEEFLIVAPEVDMPNLVGLAERIRLSVAELALPSAAGPIQVTVSLGIALHSGSDTVAPRLLLHAADSALYRAKAAGRNRHMVATSEETSDVSNAAVQPLP